MMNLQVAVIAILLMEAITAHAQDSILNKEIKSSLIQDTDETSENTENSSDSEPSIYKTKDGIIIDYKNGTTIKKSSKIKSASTTIKDGDRVKSTVLSQKGWWFDQKKARKMIEEVMEKVINEKLVTKYDIMFKEIKEIKDKENEINATLGAIQKSQDLFNRTFGNERIIDRNNTKNLQTKLRDIEKSGNDTRNQLDKTIVDMNNSLTKQINDIAEHSDTRNNTNIIRKLIGEAQNIKHEIKNEVMSAKNKISKEIEELRQTQINATDENINGTIKLDNIMKFITQEMYVINNYAKDLKNDTNKIMAMSHKINAGIIDMKENLTEGTNEVRKNNYLNSKNVMNILTSANNKSKHEIENVIQLALNTTNNNIKNTQNQLKNAFRGFADLQKRLEGENFNTTKNFTKDILQKMIDMKEIFKISNTNQTGTLLELLTKHNVQINETIKNTSLALGQSQNLTANVLEKFLQAANKTIAKNQNDSVELIKEHINKSENSTRKEISLKLERIEQDFFSTVETFNNVVNELRNNLHESTSNHSIEVDLLNKIKSNLDNITAGLQASKNSSDENINTVKREIIQKLNTEHGVLEEGLKNMNKIQNITKEEIVRELRNTTDTFKNQLSAKYRELREMIATNLKDIGNKTDSIKEMEFEMIKYGKNKERNATDDLVSKTREAVSKLLNETVTVLRNELKNNSQEDHALEKEIEKLQGNLNNVENKLFTNISQIRTDLLNGKSEILNSLGHVQNKQETMKSDVSRDMRNIEGEIERLREELDNEYRRFENKIEPNLSNIRSILNNTKETKERIEENIQVNNEIWHNFNKTKKHIKKVIAEFRENVKLIKLDLERQNLSNVEKVLLRSINKSEADLLKHTNLAKKDLLNKIDLGNRKNQASKTAILERIEHLENFLQKVINKTSVDASHAIDYERIEKVVNETKQNLTSIIYENGRNLTKQIKESPNETNRVINDSKSFLLKKLKSLGKNALDNINSKGDQVLDALRNVNERLINETNQNKKEIDSAKTDIIAGLQIINEKQNKLNRTIRKYTATFLNRLNNTDKYIINTNKTIIGDIDDMKNSLNTIGSQQILDNLNIIRLQIKIEETKDLMEKTKRDIESDIKDNSDGIMKGMTDISTSQTELETHLDKAKRSLSNVIKDTNKTLYYEKNEIAKLVNKFDQFHDHSKSIEKQQKDIIRTIKTTDIKKFIADLGTNISQDMTDFKKYFRESNENIILNVHRLGNKIKNSTGIIVHELKDPKKSTVILGQIKKTIGQLMKRLITLERYENDIRESLKNRTGDVLQDINRTRGIILSSIHSNGAILQDNILNAIAEIEKEIQDSSAKADINNEDIVEEFSKIKKHQNRIKKILDDLNAYVRKRRTVWGQQANLTLIGEDINKKKIEIVEKIDNTKRDLIHATDHLTKKINSIEDKIKCTSCNDLKDNNYETVNNPTAKVSDILGEIDVTNNDDFDGKPKVKNHGRMLRSEASNIIDKEEIDDSGNKDVNANMIKTREDNWDDIEKDNNVFDLNENVEESLDSKMGNRGSKTSASKKDEIKSKILEALQKTK